MANGTTGVETLSRRMWIAARKDVSPNVNPLDELKFICGYLAAEVEKVQRQNAELRRDLDQLTVAAALHIAERR